MVWRKTFGVLAAAFTGVLLLATPAFADTELTLNVAHRNQTAAGFTNDCSAPFSATMTEDGWHFLWPKGGDFTSLSATFTSGGPNFIVTVTSTNPLSQSGDGSTWHGYIDDTGAGDFKHVYLWTAPGWTLVDAIGTGVDGSDEGMNLTEFNLSHTCAAKPGTSPSPSPSPSASPSTSTDPGDPGTTPGGDLPTTGVALTGVVVLGVGLVAGGAAALLLLRRRREHTAS